MGSTINPKTEINELTPQQLVDMAEQLLPTQKANNQRVSRHLNKFRQFLDEVKRYGKPFRAYVRVYSFMGNYELRAFITILDKLCYEREHERVIAKLSIAKVSKLINQRYEALGLDDYIALQDIFADTYFWQSIQAIKQFIYAQNLMFCR